MIRRSISRRGFIKATAALPLLSIDWPAAPRRSLSADEDTPNVLILVFDTLSMLHTSLANYHRATTPNLDRLAESSNVYHRCYSGGNFTTPGTASLLTGTYPWSHRAFHMHGVPTEEYRTKNLFSALSHRYFTTAYTHNLLAASLLHHFRSGLNVLKPTRDLCLIDDEYSDLLFDKDYNVSFWAEWLALRGMGTPPSSLLISLADRMLRRIHKSQVEHSYGSQYPRGIPSLHSLYFVLEDAIDWMISEVPRTRQPFLSYVHLLPPHEPYSARRDFVNIYRDDWHPDPKPEWVFSGGVNQQDLDRQRRLYDEYLSFADSELGRLIDGLERAGVWDDTVLIFTSDHGELFERGIRGHVTQALFDPVMHVPLLVRRPGQQGRQDFHAPVSTIDILPTLLDMIGEPVPDWCEGEILPEFSKDDQVEGRRIFAVEAKSNSKRGPLEKRSVAMISGDYKLVEYHGYQQGTDHFEFFNLSEDPGERQELSTIETSKFAELKEGLETKIQDVNSAGVG